MRRIPLAQALASDAVQRWSTDPRAGVAPLPDLAPGELAAGKAWVLVGAADGPVRLGEVTHVGKKPMAAADWARFASVLHNRSQQAS